MESESKLLVWELPAPLHLILKCYLRLVANCIIYLMYVYPSTMWMQGGYITD